jgi:hypothetical protein
MDNFKKQASSFLSRAKQVNLIDFIENHNFNLLLFITN